MAIATIFSDVYPLPSWATDNLPTQTETTTPRRLYIAVNVSTKVVSTYIRESKKNIDRNLPVVPQRSQSLVIFFL